MHLVRLKRWPAFSPAVDGLLQRLGCIPRFVFRLNRSLAIGLPVEALEDVVQQVYAAVWPRLRDFHGRNPLETWVFGFCRNCLRSAARRGRDHGRATGSTGSGKASAATTGLDLAGEHEPRRHDDARVATIRRPRCGAVAAGTDGLRQIGVYEDEPIQPVRDQRAQREDREGRYWQDEPDDQRD